MMELIKGLSDNVLGIIGSGTITGEDYDTVLIPAMEDLKTMYASDLTASASWDLHF